MSQAKCSKLVRAFLAGEEKMTWAHDGRRKILIVYESSQAADKYYNDNKSERSLGGEMTSMVIANAAEVQQLLDNRPEIKHIVECGVSRLCSLAN